MNDETWIKAIKDTGLPCKEDGRPVPDSEFQNLLLGYSIWLLDEMDDAEAAGWVREAATDKVGPFYHDDRVRQGAVREEFRENGQWTGEPVPTVRLAEQAVQAPEEVEATGSILGVQKGHRGLEGIPGRTSQVPPTGPRPAAAGASGQ